MRSLLLGGMAIGLAAFLSSLFMSPQKGWTSFLLGSYLILCLGLAGVFILALFYAVSAEWAAPLRRVPEAMAAVLPYGAIGLAITFAAYPSLYPWTAGSINGVAITGFKKMWLNFPFFLIRAAVYVSVWIAFSRAIRRRSNVRASIAFLVVFGFTFWLATTDWIMSLDPLWYSTIFAVYNFSGLLTSGLAMMMLLVLWLRKGPFAKIVRDDQIEDLGKVLFGFCTFWMYIWFCQYMLIWYGNLPEETPYYLARTSGAWTVPFLLNVAVNWVVPFLVLMPRASKRNLRVLKWTAIVMLAGRWLDLYVAIMPALYRSPAVHAVDLAILAGCAAGFFLLATRALAAAPLVPLNNPSFYQSLAHHQ
jgi:hypothetical protein